MSQAIERKIISTIMEFIHTNDYKDLDGFSSKITQNYTKLITAMPIGVTKEQFFNSIKKISTNFFIVNKVSKKEFSEKLYNTLIKIELPFTNYEIAEHFLSQYMEIGYEKNKHVDERKKIISFFKNSKNPHEKIIHSFEILLQRIKSSYQITLHGTKEYSGIDVCKVIKGTTIGFQIKSRNDSITEDKIRAQTSKALEYKLDGFVWIYARPPLKTVDSSIQAAFHHYKRLNEQKKMYCTIIDPERLAELFCRYEVIL